MYETEVNHKTESISGLPADVVSAFRDLNGKILSRTLIQWGEHCTECGWPTCYSTCDLYAPREDLKCRRFMDGMVRIDCDDSVNGYLLKISFKRWGKLWARGNFRLYSPTHAHRVERRDYRLGTALQQFPLPDGVKRKAALKRYAFKKRLASRGFDSDLPPTDFLLECYNPHSETVGLSLTIRSLYSEHPSRFKNLVQLAPGFRHARELKESKLPFQYLVEVAPGFNRTRIPFQEIARVVKPSAPYAIDITPNEAPEGVTLYFGVMDFVTESELKADKVNDIKCVIWDLDNTMWEGILVEDGQEKLRLRPGIAEVIRSLDKRGILHSVASKNNGDDAMQAIKGFGLSEYFLYPQISWRPKSESIKVIANALNIGMDTLLFVDDSPFELQEVLAACPGVNVLEASKYREIPEMKACKVKVTAASTSRRGFYQVETQRKAAAEGFGDDYLSFLRDCKIRLKISRLTNESLDRVHELATRTNQMNFSGNRYDLDLLRKVISTPHLNTFVLTCEDRFGNYGTIGFSIVDEREPRMTDLMFSCRVQSKRVEHAFLAFAIRKYRRVLGNDFLASYRKTEKNTPAGQVFKDLGMQELRTTDGLTLLSFPKDRLPPEDGIIEIETTD